MHAGRLCRVEPGDTTEVPMFATSCPCAMTTSGSRRPRGDQGQQGTRKCAQATSTGGAAATLAAAARDSGAFPPAAAIEHGELDLMATFAQCLLDLGDEGAEVRVGRARIHL